MYYLKTLLVIIGVLYFAASVVQHARGDTYRGVISQLVSAAGILMGLLL